MCCLEKALYPVHATYSAQLMPGGLDLEVRLTSDQTRVAAQVHKLEAVYYTDSGRAALWRHVRFRVTALVVT